MAEMEEVERVLEKVVEASAPKMKRVVIKEPSAEAPKVKVVEPATRDKGKGIMDEPEKKKQHPKQAQAKKDRKLVEFLQKQYQEEAAREKQEAS